MSTPSAPFSPTRAVGARAGDRGSRISELLAVPARHDHIVQFYEGDDALVDSVTQFLRAGFAAGEPVIVIATPEHAAKFMLALDREGIDSSAVRRSGQLALLDARATLARIMVGRSPDWQRFRAAMGGVIERQAAQRPGHNIRAYGEMVDLLWRDGNRHAAIRVEEMWNELGREHSFSLFCAYVMGNFYSSSDAAQFDRVCGVHTHVIPAESYAGAASDDEQLRAITSLQQRARALEHEIAHRRQLEVALRDSLARETAMREETERAIRFTDMFAGILGHDLRDPLGAITMGADYILHSEVADDTVRAAARIVNSADWMARMIDQLLDFTRIRAAGGLELRRAEVDLGSVCARVRDELPAGVIELRAAGDPKGEWDHDRLRQVFSNLVGNAVAHGAPDAAVTVDIDGTSPTEVTVHVCNVGAIDAEVLPVIFDPFRGGMKVRGSRGLGLGLFITRQIVLAHGGQIVTLSADAHTTMSVQLPRRPPPVDDDGRVMV